jgi:mRNA export factor
MALQAAKKNSQEYDMRFPSPPGDGVSSISVNGYNNAPTNLAIVTSWDNTVNCYEIQSNNQGQHNIVPQGQITHDTPVLCSDFCSTDNTTVFSGSCDGVIKMWNVTQGPNSAQQIGKHDLAVRHVKFIGESNLLVSSSWDKTIKIWDMRTPNPVATLQHTERVHAMDAKSTAIVAVTADKQVHVYDLSGGSRKVSEFKSPLSYQTRCIALFADNKGFAMGCIEGRVAVEYFDELQYKNNQGNTLHKQKSDNFIFKCHRDGSDIFSVNSIAFSPLNTFCSVGSDGVLSFWDKEARYKLANLELLKKKCPINEVTFNPQGSLLLYSASYDWSRGAEHNDASFGTAIYLHQVQAQEVTPREQKKK